MDGSSSSGSGGSRSRGGVGDGGSASAVAVAAAASAGNRDQGPPSQPQHQNHQPGHRRQLQMRRLSYTTPATPFVGTPAGAPPDPATTRTSASWNYSSGPSDPLGSTNNGDDGVCDDGDDNSERKMPADPTQQQQQGQPVAVDSHLHLDDIRHPPLHPLQPRPRHQSQPQSAAAYASAAAASASASAPHSQQPQQHPQPHPTPQTRSSALLSAQYYASCALASIPPSLADRAVKSAHAAFRVS